MPRLPAKIIEVVEHTNSHTQYRLASLYGLLDVCFYAKDLESHVGVLPELTSEVINLWQQDNKKISLRQASAAASQHSVPLELVTAKCNCNGECDSKRCVCFKAQKQCTSHCHAQNKQKKV